MNKIKALSIFLSIVSIFALSKQIVTAQATPPTCNGKTATIWVDAITNAPTLVVRNAGGIIQNPYSGSITGTSGNDVIMGSSGNDNIDGTQGNDTICGGAGNDILTGGEGSDMLLGGDGDDTLNAQNGGDILYGGSGTNILNAGNGTDLCYTNGGSNTTSGCETTNPNPATITLANNQIQAGSQWLSYLIVACTFAILLVSGYFYSRHIKLPR